MYLIEAEAKHYQDDDTGAQAAMNTLIKIVGEMHLIHVL